MARPKNSELARRIAVSDEPSFGASEITDIELVKSLNWYSQNKDSKDAEKYIGEFLKRNKYPKQDIEAFDLADKKAINTLGFLCRMIMNGAILPIRYKTQFDFKINNLIANGKSKIVIEKVKSTSSNTVSVLDRVKEAALECCGDLEGAIDEVIASKFKTYPSPYSIMTEYGIKPMHANKIVAVFREVRKQYDSVIDSDDPQIKEGYSNFKKSDIKKLVTYCDQIISDALKIVDAGVKTRKPRKRKVKTPDQLVAKIKVCIEDKELGVKSVSPKEIIGAQQVWVFNRKYRKLGCYNAADISGFSVKGTSILNYAESKSIAKTVRKPEKTVKEVISGGKVFLRNVLDNIKAKESNLNGRLNSDTIILRVIK